MQQLAGLSGKYVANLSPRVRAILLAAGAAVIVAAVALAYLWRSDSASLFPTALEGDQVAEVTARLTEWDIPFTATADNVRVDPARRRDVLLRLGMAHVPHAHVASSSESLRDVNALTPQALLDAQEREGLEGDLALGLRGVTGIGDARVKIAPATHGVFIDEPSHDATAAVFVTLEPGATLSPDAVSGIRSYVASAVPGLAPERVQIMDQNGESLGTREVAAGTTEDKALEATLQTALDRTVGPGLSFVLARVESDPTSTTQREVKHVALGDKPIAANSVREHYAGKNKSYDKVRENDDRGSDTLETNKRIDPGATKRLSLAVFVDQSRADVIPRIKSVLAAGAGLVPARGDTLVVQAIAFAHPAGPAQLLRSSPPVLASIGASLPLVLIAFAALVAFAVVVRPFVIQMSANAERLAVEQRRADVAEFEPTRIYATLRGEPAHSAAAILSALPAATTASVLELYDPDARREIVKRLTRALPPVVRDLSAKAGGV